MRPCSGVAAIAIPIAASTMTSPPSIPIFPRAANLTAR